MYCPLAPEPGLHQFCPRQVGRRRARAPGAQRHSTFTTSNALAPPGVTTSTESPFFLPTSARASGDVIEMRFFLASASGSPTICHTFFSSVSSSTTVTVAPNVMVSPDSFETSITSADRKSTRLNSSHVKISYAVFCLKKKKKKQYRL